MEKTEQTTDLHVYDPKRFSGLLTLYIEVQTRSRNPRRVEVQDDWSTQSMFSTP